MLTTTLPVTATDYSPKQEGGHCSHSGHLAASKKTIAPPLLLCTKQKTTGYAVVFTMSYRLKTYELTHRQHFIHPGSGQTAKTLPSEAQTN